MYKMRKWRGEVVWCGLFVAGLIFVWWLSGEQTLSLSARTAVAKFLRLLGDAALLSIPFAIAGRRGRVWGTIFLWVVALWEIGSVWYFRFWGDIPGLSSLLLGRNLNVELLRSTLGLWQWRDVLFLLPPVVLTLCVARVGGRTAFTRREKWGYAIASVVLFVGGQGVATHVFRSNQRLLGMDTSFLTATAERIEVAPLALNRDRALNGPVVGFFKQAKLTADVLGLRRDLTESDRREVEAFISSVPSWQQVKPADSIVEANSRKNVVLLLVESLNSGVVGRKVGGREVTPTLNALIGREGTLSALDVLTQVGAGGSGDGQLIANTGLFPINGFSAAMAVGSRNTFPSLCRSLGRETDVVVFADDMSAWNEHDTFQSYGFDSLYSRNDFPLLIEAEGGDGALLTFGASLMPSLSRPFFMELLTVSMHVPFRDKTIPEERIPSWIDTDASLSRLEADYLKMTAYFDAELNRFLNRLDSLGLADNTIVAIVSDHSQDVVSAGREEEPMAIIIANCGVSKRVERRVAQTEFFPTLLALTGTTGPQGWRGTAPTLLDAAPLSDSADSLARAVSHTILSTDFFAGVASEK